MNFKRYHISTNLFDKNTTPVSLYYQTTRKVITQTAGVVSIIMPVSPNTTYTFNNPTGNRNRICETETVPEIDDTVINYIASDGDVSITLTTSNNTHYILWWVGYQQEYSNIADALSVNLGSTPLPYEPYSSEVWHDTPHYIHKTDTDTLTTLPADIYANGITATVGLKGNMSQSSTPMPTTPIQPSECGDLSINLTPNQKITSNVYSYTTTTHPLINALKNITPNENYTLSWEFSSNGSGGVNNQIRLYVSASGTMIKILQPGVSFTLTSEEIANLGALFCYFGISNTDGYMDKFMLVEGSTAKDYEPYGQYKIPILNNSQTTNVYLGEVQSTRRIKKLVLTGEENWSGYSLSASGVGAILNLSDMLNNGRHNGYCTHFVAQYSPNASAINGITFGASNTTIYITFSTATATALNLTDTTSIKTWLAQQYANGTPVSIWYILATETTGIVNEPLCKIGDYADEVSGITIPVTAGANTLSIGTTLQPSEVTATYKGWHPIQSVHERENGQWD